MRYIGGKSKFSKALAQIIVAEREDRTAYIEPFVGGGAVLAKIAPEFATAYASDVVPDLILMWQALQDGWEPPEVVTREQYAELRQAEPTPERGFVGFGGSFGGKWFGGYASGGVQSSGEPRNHQAESARRLRSMVPGIKNVEFRLCDYREWDSLVSASTVVYADPPYAGTHGYGAAGPFDSEEFWRVMADWRERGALVLVSEYEAPEGWESVWERGHWQTLQRGDRERFRTTERLWR